jgi:hypothetical protein
MSTSQILSPGFALRTQPPSPAMWERVAYLGLADIILGPLLSSTLSIYRNLRHN